MPELESANFALAASASPSSNRKLNLSTKSTYIGGVHRPLTAWALKPPRALKREQEEQVRLLMRTDEQEQQLQLRPGGDVRPETAGVSTPSPMTMDVPSRVNRRSSHCSSLRCCSAVRTLDAGGGAAPPRCSLRSSPAPRRSPAPTRRHMRE